MLKKFYVFQQLWKHVSLPEWYWKRCNNVPIQRVYHLLEDNDHLIECGASTGDVTADCTLDTCNVENNACVVTAKASTGNSHASCLLTNCKVNGNIRVVAMRADTGNSSCMCTLIKNCEFKSNWCVAYMVKSSSKANTPYTVTYTNNISSSDRDVIYYAEKGDQVMEKSADEPNDE